MSQKPIVMDQLKQILQLKCDGIGIREIARRTGISRNSVRKYLLFPATSLEKDVAYSFPPLRALLTCSKKSSSILVNLDITNCDHPQVAASRLQSAPRICWGQ